jgi:predicted permease
MLDDLRRDIRQACRTFLAMPVLAGVIVVSLGVGIGVNTVVFSWIQALVFRPLPGVPDGSSFLHVEARAENGTRPGSSWLEYRDLQRRVTALPDLLAYRMVPFNLGESSRTERTYGLLVSGNYFSALGLQPAMGRFLRADEASEAGREPVVVVSFDYWQARMASAPDVIGRRVRVNGHDLTIVGVTPEGFQGTVIGLQFDLWVPATLAPVLFDGSRELEDRSIRGYAVMGRLGEDRSVAQAQAEASGAMQELALAHPTTNAGMRSDLLSYWQALRGPPRLMLQGLALLQGIMLILLLAVCGNTANLVLARATARQREIAVRLAVGAGAWRIVRLLLVESLVLGVAAAALGTAIAVWGTQALRAVPFLTTAFAVRFQTSINEAGLAFAIVLGILCAVIFGMAPALQLARVDPQMVLRSTSAISPRSLGRQLLMAGEVALAMVVLVSAGLFVQSFRETREDPGFRREGVLLAAYDLYGRNLDAAAARDFAGRLLNTVRKLPGVDSAAIATQVPLDIHGLPLRTFTLEGRARTDAEPERVLTNTITTGYFETMDIPFVAGSDFVPLADTSAPAQAIVNEEFARRYAGKETTLGRSVQIGSTRYVIGAVVRNSLYESFGEPPTPIVYLSFRDRPAFQGEIHVRTRVGDATLLTSSIRGAVRQIDQSLPVYNVRTLTQHVDTNLALRRIPARMFIVLGPLLLVLAAIGIYAVVAYTVAQRTSEIGIRLAIGATARRVIAQIVRENLLVIVLGGAAGWAFVFAIYTRFLRGAVDLPAFVAVPALLLAVAVASCWLPARRAARLDPMLALRSE